MKKMWIHLWVAVLVMSSFLSCGKRRPEVVGAESVGGVAGEAKGLVSTASQALNPWIIDGGERNPLLPSADSSKAERKVFVSNENIIFENVVRISDLKSKFDPVERTLYLVWNELALGSPIINAYYRYEKRNVLNQRLFDDERRNVSQDKETGRWFIPLNQAFDGALTYSDPTVTHWLTLELHLGDVSVVFLKVGVRVLGLLPKLAVQNLPLDSNPSGLGEFSQTVHEKGWIVGKERLTNPTGRELSLWLRTPRDGLQWDSKILFKTFIFEGASGENAHISERNIPYRSTFPIQVKQLQVERSGAGASEVSKEVIAVNSSKWIQIAFHPHETLTFEWRGLSESRRERFGLPGPRQLDFHWKIHRSARGRSEDSGAMFDSGERSTSRTETWTLKSARLSGSWSRTILIADPYVMEAQLESETSDRVLSLIKDQGQDVNFISGEWLDGGESYSNQGYIY